MARSAPIAPNVGRLSRSQLAGKRGLYKGECAEVQSHATRLLGCLLKLCDFTRQEDRHRPRQGGEARHRREVHRRCQERREEDYLDRQGLQVLPCAFRLVFKGLTEL